MAFYMRDLSLFDFTSYCEDPIISPISLNRSYSSTNSSITSHISNGNNNHSSNDKVVAPKPKSPPSHRHDGMSPLPLGMDWSLPPRKWEGRNSIWPHDPHRGWSYCVTIPSWILSPNSRRSQPVAFYRVQVGIQSPERITSTRVILRRFSDFLQLLSELKRALPQKTLPPAPPKTILRMKRETLLEERRRSLEDWMEKILSDIHVSRSAPVGTFLELEAAARLSFEDVNQQSSDANSAASGRVPSVLVQTNSDVSILAGSSLIASDHGYDSPNGISELGTPKQGRDNNDLDMEASTSNRIQKFSKGKVWPGIEEKNIICRNTLTGNMSKDKCLLGEVMESLPEAEYLKLDGDVWTRSTGSLGSDLSSISACEISNLGLENLFGDDLPEGAETPKINNVPLRSNLQLGSDVLLALPSHKLHKVNRVLNTLQHRLVTAKTDMEELIARLNQEVAVRKFLTTKIKDLEVDLDTTRDNCKENMQQTVLNERERYTHLQWDVEEIRRKCMEMEMKLKSEQEERACLESTKILIIQENEMLLQQLSDVRLELENLHNDHEQLELTSKAEEKLLVKEVKSLRSTQSELKQEFSHLMKEKLEIERFLQKEKQRANLIATANSNLLHECEILRSRLQECSVNFSIEEDKLIVGTSSPSDAIDLLATSDNRIGLLLAEAQLLEQDAENSLARSDETHNMNGDHITDDELRKMLTEIFVDNARLRMQVNSVIRCALNSSVKSDEDEEEETSLRKTVLSKFLER